MKIYHNNRCSKSRQTLELLQKNNAQVKEFNYLIEKIDANELKFIILKLGIKAEQLIRKGEDIYKTNFKGKNLTDQEWIAAMIEHPKLIERPIVINGEKVAIGRPPENILAIL
ncbi:MAG: arsenate reductase (glutaredoxin) [Crocinitomicaceae bacterium]